MDLGQAEHNTKLLPTKAKLPVKKQIGGDNNCYLRWAMGLGLIKSTGRKTQGRSRLPVGSSASQLTLHSGHFSFSFLAMPVTVPPVPDPITTMWTLPAGQGRERLAGTQHGLQHSLPFIQHPSAARTPCAERISRGHAGGQSVVLWRSSDELAGSDHS